MAEIRSDPAAETPCRPRESVDKHHVVDALRLETSALKKYQHFFVGTERVFDLVRYEAAMLLASWAPGAPGFALRKLLYPGLFLSAGKGVNFGRDISLRCPGRIALGDDVAIDDGCALDARGTTEPGDFSIGDRTLISRDTILLVKSNYLRIGADCSIGTQCNISAVSGVEIGDDCIIAGHCYIGGGRYKTALGAGPMARQGLETKGPVRIGNDVWLGAHVTLLDGVTVGDGAILAAGAVVNADVAENTIVAGVPARPIGTRQ
ncbi:MAG: acyltransferase [Paracoccaceae bacterium]|nr:acyltransferase [Paracoccaceae bacterium]